MQSGLAMPLAIAALIGAVLGSLAPPGLIEAWVLALLLGARCRNALLMLLVMALVAGQVLWARQAQLPQGLSGVDVRLEGRLASVETQEGHERLLVDVTACRPLEPLRMPCDRLRRVRLNDYAQDRDWQAGERWALTARLRPPRGFSNPHAFDYAAWLWREGIDATGYLRSDPDASRREMAGMSLKRLALTHLDAQPLDATSRRWLAALTLGAGERLESQDWDLLNASGTTHLVVISGLHVGLVAAFALLLARGAARLLTPGRWRMVVWPWWAAALAAGGYAWLAGLEPPAMRALLMTLVGLWVASGRHAPGPWQGWWLALALVVTVDPLATWRPGFWLSFVAVALLILAWQGRERPAGLRGWCLALFRTQALLAPWMMAAVLLAFERLAPAAPLINLLAVPLMSVLMVPLGMLGWLLAGVPVLSLACWQVFAWLTQGLEAMLGEAIAWLPLWIAADWQVWPLALALGGIALLWALPGLERHLRASGTLALGMLPLCLEPPVLAQDAVRLRVYDVGQGQLIELRTAQHRLLYDTGPRFRSGFMPLGTLWPTGQHFDRVIVSHDDLDHAGGVPALAEHHVGVMLAPPGSGVATNAMACRAGDEWQWDGATFRFLWPPADHDERWSDNDGSCVLLVEIGERRMLITGDVSSDIERRFLRQVASPVDVLVAGHHGSQTSSGPQLVQELAPRHVIFSAGRDNAFGHPHGEVVRRFRREQACLWNTAIDGAVTLWVAKESEPIVSIMRRLAGTAVEGRCHRVKSHS